MRKLVNILIIATALLVAACEGPVGPMGPPGEDGGLYFASVFEFQGDFTPGNGYSILKPFPSNVEIYESDVVLVYLLWETDDGLDVWRLMPQTVFIREQDVYGEVLYNYDYTYENFRVFLEFTINEEDLLPSETDDQWFRVAVVPAEFAKNNDLTDFNALLKSSDIKFSNFDLSNSTINSVKE